MSTLKIERTNEYSNRLREYGIYVDNMKIGNIANGETKEFIILPGLHILQCKIDWCSSPEMPIQITEKQIAAFRVGSFAKGNFLMQFVTIYYITLGRKQYLTLEEL